MSQPDDRALYQELRFALVFNGGVSLAVWMGGVAKEIDRFRRAFYQKDDGLGPYRALLEALRTEVVTDVVAGTSAGGINGALLGFVVANGKSLEVAGKDTIRDVWDRLGSIDKLLAAPDPPASALNGQFLFDGCADVFKQLTDATPDLTAAAPRQLRLTVTTTDSQGYPVDVDGVWGLDHRLEMRFRHVDVPSEIRLSVELRLAIEAIVEQPVADGAWPFPQRPSPRDLAGTDAAALLARAARSTASFPIAFAPSILPLDDHLPALPRHPALTATPAMRRVVATRGGAQALDGTHDRYVVDGGLWDNAPFEAVLRNIDRTPSGRDVDRRLVYIVATDEQPPPAPKPDAPDLIKSVTQTLTTPSNVSFANDLERIRADLAQQRTRRESFDWLLADGPPDVFALAQELYPIYRRRLAAGTAGSAQVPPEDLTLDAGAPLEAWLATPADWQWGIRPVAAAIELGRRLTRDVMRVLESRGGTPAPDVDAARLVRLREELSQLAWALSDLQDRCAGRALTPGELAVCGQAMHDFAVAVAELNETLVAVSAAAPPTQVLQAAARLTAGGPELVVKRAIATEICVHSLAADHRRHKVDYTFQTIRPDGQWPARDGTTPPTPPPPPPRPPLAGTRYGHFGGFLLTSWRLSDWMWGRLDGSTRVVDMLLDVAQVKRLTARNPSAVEELAGRLAAVAVPAGGATPRVDTHRLAYEAYLTHGLRGDADAPAQDPSAFESATEADCAAMVTAWRVGLAGHYAKAIDTARKSGEDGTLVPVRADLRRQIQLAILRDEIPGLLAQAQQEGCCTGLHDDDLALEADRGLRSVVLGLAKDIPRLTLLQDAEVAAANTLDALHHGGLAAGVRGLGRATHKLAAFGHAVRVAGRYVTRRHARPGASR